MEQYEAVLFFNNSKVAKQMLYSEFEAVLDGVVGVADLAGQEVRAAYVTINRDLSVHSIVLFLVGFDKQGRADRDWNIPLRHLAENAGPGPDLGNGPIRLACRSQCSVAWYAKELWEPTAQQGDSLFHAIRDAIKKNKLGLKVEARTSAKTSAPLLDEIIPPVLDTIAEPQPELEQQYRAQLQSLANNYRQKLQTLDERRKQELDQIKRVLRNETQAHKQQAQEWEQKLSQQTVLYENLMEKYKKSEQEVQSLKDKVIKQLEKLDQLKEEQKELQSQQQLLSKSESDQIKTLQQQVSSLKQELKASQSEKTMLESSLDDKTAEHEQQLGNFIKDMEQQDLMFVAYQPGAGHMTLAAKNLPEYLEDPTGFAASRCGVTTTQYLSWLEHYESGVCLECQTSIKRIDSPSDFVEGHHDYCIRHKKVSASVTDSA